MTPMLDASALIFASLVVGNLMALTVVLAGPKLGIRFSSNGDERARGLTFWAVGTASIASGIGVLGLQAPLDGVARVASMVAGNGLALLGMWFLNVGLALFRDVPPRSNALGVLLAASFVGTIAFGFEPEAYPQRAVAAAVGLAIGELNLLRLLLAAWSEARSIYSTFVLSILLPLAATAYRAVDLATSGGGATFVDGSLSNGLLHGAILASFAISSTSMLALYGARQRRLTQEASDELQMQARTDGLTGVANRRAFTRLLHEELARARRYGRPVALVSFDLDRFKRINDTFGHMMGDRVLKAVASDVASGLRRTDMLARMGGEEFSVLLPETTAFEARGMAERLRRLIEARSDAERDPPLDLSASFGVAAFDGRESQDDVAHLAETLQSDADEALYQAKRAGRNCVRMHAASTRRPDDSAPARAGGAGDATGPNTTDEPTDEA